MEVLSFIGSTVFSYFKSVAPLAALLVLVRIFILGGAIESALKFTIGIVLATIGLALFVESCGRSLVPMAGDLGRELVNVKWPVILLIAFALGFAATLVEPALLSTARQVDDQTAGAISQRTLMMVTAVGVAFGMTLGVGRVLANWEIFPVLLPLLSACIVLAYYSGDKFPGIAFDCASATTGPVNIPVNLAIAVGLAEQLEGVDPLKAGLGIVGFTCLGAALAVMLYGMVAGRAL